MAAIWGLDEFFSRKFKQKLSVNSLQFGLLIDVLAQILTELW